MKLSLFSLGGALGAFAFALAPAARAESPSEPAVTAPAACKGHDHAHSEHDHAEHSGHEHAHEDTEHTHAHEACTHDPAHEAHADHEGHDHAHEGHDHDHAGHDHGGGHEEEHVHVTVTPKALHALDMSFEKVPEPSSAPGRTLYGTLSVPPDAVHICALPSAGRVYLKVKPAQEVKKGDVLYTLESPALVELAMRVETAAAALRKAEAEALALETRRARLEAAGAKNGELETTIAFKRAETAALEKDLAAARAQMKSSVQDGELENGTLVVRAPADGTVGSAPLAQGAWAEQGATVLDVAARGVLEWSAPLYAGDEADAVRARLVTGEGGELQTHEGTLRVGNQIDPQTQTRTLYFRPASVPEGLRAGQTARLDLLTADEADGGYISVPNSAIVKVGVDDVVFVREDEHTMVMQKVEALPSRRGLTPVKGLTPGATYVSKGGYELKYLLPTMTGKKAAGHFHADGKFHEGDHSDDEK